MYERNKKPTLEQIRTLFPFDVPTVASAAGVATDTLYYALQQRPILQQEAAKILVALSQHTGLSLSFQQVDIIVWEEFLLLWLIRANAFEPASSGDEDRYHFVYAQDQQHAAILAQEWLRQHPNFPYHSFTACPRGFRIGELWVPGRQPREI